MCWHVDRLTRNPRELEDVIDLADRHGIELATCTREIDLSTPTGRLVARMLGAAARHESVHKAERQRRQARQSAEQGIPHITAQRGYGYTRDMRIVEEAEVIRDWRRGAPGRSRAPSRGCSTCSMRRWAAWTFPVPR